jgi:hypothetical protein
MLRGRDTCARRLQQVSDWQTGRQQNSNTCIHQQPAPANYIGCDIIGAFRLQCPPCHLASTDWSHLLLWPRLPQSLPWAPLLLLLKVAARPLTYQLLLLLLKLLAQVAGVSEQKQA